MNSNVALASTTHREANADRAPDHKKAGAWVIPKTRSALICPKYHKQ